MLTWMQEHRSDVFMFATANQVWQLPPELTRRGRFDDLFFLRLPSAVERSEIFNIHLAARGRKPSKFDIDALVQASRDFTGSECEEAIIAGMYTAFESGHEVRTADIVRACKTSIPMIHTMSEDVAALEKWGEKRARPASTSKDSAKGEVFRHLTSNMNTEGPAS